MATPTPQTRTLMRALEVAGSAERLAQYLGCDKAQLARWITGDELAPSSIYLQALDLVSYGPPEDDRGESG